MVVVGDSSSSNAFFFLNPNFAIGDKYCNCCHLSYRLILEKLSSLSLKKHSLAAALLHKIVFDDKSS